MISPLTNERKFGDVSTEDFTTLGVAVVQNSSDIATNAAKPSSSQVDSQIDAKNTTQMTQLYTKTETDAALALKGSAAGLATVSAYASGLHTTATVNNLIDSKKYHPGHYEFRDICSKERHVYEERSRYNCQ